MKILSTRLGQFATFIILKVQCKFDGMLKWDIQRIILVFNILWKFLRERVHSFISIQP